MRIGANVAALPVGQGEQVPEDAAGAEAQAVVTQHLVAQGREKARVRSTMDTHSRVSISWRHAPRRW